MARNSKESIDAAAYKHDGKHRLNNPESGNIDRVPNAKETKKVYNWEMYKNPQIEPRATGRVQIKVYDTRGNAVVKTVRV